MRSKTESRVTLLIVVIGMVAMFVAAISRPVFSGEYLMIEVVFFLILFEVPFAVWVFRDAENRGVDDPMQYAAAIIVPLFGLLVFFAYLSFRHELSEDGSGEP